MMDRGFAETENGRILAGMARNCLMTILTGLPASGKSFFLRAPIPIAGTAGRRVHLMRWDTGLALLQTDEILARYPDVVDGSHPIVRKVAGLWGRQAFARWQDMRPVHADLLVGGVPIAGYWFSDLMKVLPDEAEAALASKEKAFVYPVPAIEVREMLEVLWRQTFVNPRHPDEAKDAPPATMDLAWKLTRTKCIELGLVQAAEGESTPAYDAVLYSRFFGHLLQNRNARAQDVDLLHASSGSPHDIQGGISEIFSTPGEVEEALAAIEAVLDPEGASRAVENRY